MSLVSYGLALASACLAIAGFAASSPRLDCWLALLGGFAFLIIGLQVHSEARGAAYVLARSDAERSTLESQVRRQRESIDMLADALDVAIFICDARGVVQYANVRAVDMFRFENPLGRSLLAVTLAYDLERLVLDAGRTGIAQNAEIAFTYPDERVGVAKAWRPVDQEDQVFVSIFEITSLRHLERIRQDFVSNVSHELRTPLTVIRAMAETLADEHPPDQDQLDRYLPRIITEVDRLATISNDLLLLSAAESNPVRKSRCDLVDIVRGVVHQLQQKAADKDLELDFESPDQLLVEANPGQMVQVAINLIDNAVNYTSKGSVHVSIQSDATTAFLRVSDTGIGIASEHQPRIFERFYRVDRARSRSTGGTGLGLSIVKHIVESHGGSVGIESALNRGSTFTVELPIGNLSGSPVEE